MKNSIKKMLMVVSIVGVTVMIAGCSSSNDSAKTENETKTEYVQTHQNDDVKTVKAKMYQKKLKDGTADEMGYIKFTETESGLKMVTDLKKVRPDVEYKLYVYDIKGCDKSMKDKSKDKKKCDKEKKDIDLPELVGDKDGTVKTTFMITGLTAAELEDAKITLVRDDDHGEKVKVGWGKIAEKGLFK